MDNTSAEFELYRYQILPINRFLQTDLWKDYKSVEQLLKHKNQIFRIAIEEVKSFSNSRTKVNTKRILNQNDIFLFRIGANRSILRETVEFQDEYIESWPSIYVAINNHPDVQMIAVQKRTSAFQNTELVVKLILEAIHNTLGDHHLRVITEPIVERTVFWDLVKEYQGKIEKVEFEFLTPNMANISKNLSEDLKDFCKSTNSQVNKIQLESDSSSALNLDHNNPTIHGLANYASDGGGNVTFKIRGMKKTIKTSRSVKSIQISDIELTGSNEDIANTLGILLK